MSTRWSASCWRRKASTRSRNWRWSTRRRSPAIEGFDEETAHELQARARDYLAQLEGELDAKRKELGVEDALKDVPGVTTKMLVEVRRKRHQDRRGSGGLRDRRPGRLERAQGRRGGQAQPGVLDGFDLSREEAEALIMQARVKAGWISEADLAPPAPCRGGRGAAGGAGLNR